MPKKKRAHEGSVIFNDLLARTRTETLDRDRESNLNVNRNNIITEVSAEHLDLFSDEPKKSELQQRPEKRQLNNEPSTQAQQEKLQNQPPFRHPQLESLTVRALKKFKKELEAAEELRKEFNQGKSEERQIPSPNHVVMVPRRLWSQILVDMRKNNSSLQSFADATYEEFETWLIQSLVPQPNNRPFIRKLEAELSNAWSRSYFYGITSCFPFPNRDNSKWAELRDPAEWDIDDSDKKHLTATSVASSVSIFSRNSQTSYFSDDNHLYAPQAHISVSSVDSKTRENEHIFSNVEDNQHKSEGSRVTLESLIEKNFSSMSLESRKSTQGVAHSKNHSRKSLVEIDIGAASNNPTIGSLLPLKMPSRSNSLSNRIPSRSNSLSNKHQSENQNFRPPHLSNISEGSVVSIAGSSNNSQHHFSRRFSLNRKSHHYRPVSGKPVLN